MSNLTGCQYIFFCAYPILKRTLLKYQWKSVIIQKLYADSSGTGSINYVRGGSMKLPSERDKCAFTTTGDVFSALRSHAKKRGVPEKTAQWYVIWARQFLRSIKGKKLQDCTIADVQSFLSYLYEKNTTTPWQLTQIQDTLLFIFKDLLKFQWATEINHLFNNISVNRIKDPETVPAEGASNKDPHMVRTTKPLSTHKELLHKLKTEIRVR